jgi:hypothetical protein
MEQKCHAIAKEMENWAKKNHQWDNQTGELEKSISSFVRREGDIWIFGIDERMEYAKWVERRKDKGVLEITKEHFMPDIRKSLLNSAKVDFEKAIRAEITIRYTKR